MLDAAVKAASLEHLLDAVLSVEDVGVYKPHPKVYQLAVDRLGIPASAISFQSSNSWDAYAASAFGMRVVWCNRYAQRLERLPGAPDERYGLWPNFLPLSERLEFMHELIKSTVTWTNLAHLMHAGAWSEGRFGRDEFVRSARVGSAEGLVDDAVDALGVNGSGLAGHLAPLAYGPDGCS